VYVAYVMTAAYGTGRIHLLSPN